MFRFRNLPTFGGFAKAPPYKAPANSLKESMIRFWGKSWKEAWTSIILLNSMIVLIVGYLFLMTWIFN